MNYSAAYVSAETAGLAVNVAAAVTVGRCCEQFGCQAGNGVTGCRHEEAWLRAQTAAVKALAPLLARRASMTVDEINDAAAVSTAWHSLARGGEVAPGVPPSAWRAWLHPSRDDLSFGRAHGRNFAKVMLRPLKKKGKALQPMPLRYSCTPVVRHQPESSPSRTSAWPPFIH